MCSSNKSLDRFSECIKSFVDANWPGVSAESVTITFSDGRAPFTLPRPSHVAAAGGKSARSCSPDGTTVRWHGERFTFRAMQARAVRILWDAMEADTPDIRQDSILEEIGSESRRLSDVFRGSPAWGKVIVPGERGGTFRIADNLEE